MKRQPSLFISHGAPTFALQPGAAGAALREIGPQLHDAAAVLVVSPHWSTDGVRVMTTPAPETLHDFGGFGPELEALAYPAPGAPVLARETLALLDRTVFDTAADDRRGLDHGAWVPLMHLLPAARTPVFQVSLPRHLGPAGALLLGEALAPMRDRGVAIVGSGSLTHNLFDVFGGYPADPAYAHAFAGWVRDAVARRDVAALADFRHRAPHARRAHPTDEHFLPLLVAFAASSADDAARHIAGGMTYGVLSMDSFAWVLPDHRSRPAHQPERPRIAAPTA